MGKFNGSNQVSFSRFFNRPTNRDVYIPVSKVMTYKVEICPIFGRRGGCRVYVSGWLPQGAYSAVAMQQKTAPPGTELYTLRSEEDVAELKALISKRNIKYVVFPHREWGKSDEEWDGMDDEVWALIERLATNPN